MENDKQLQLWYFLIFKIYNQGLYSKKSIHKAILNSAKTLQFYQSNPRMIPEGVEPKSHKMFITVKQAYKPNKEIILDSQPPPKSTKSKSMLITSNDIILIHVWTLCH